MGDIGLWVAGLTGATAVLASWVTSRGHTRAAQLQAEAAAEVQDRARRNEARQTSYLAFIEQAHLMGGEYRLTPTILSVEDPEQRGVRLGEHRARLRELYGPFGQSCALVALHGYSAEAVDACNAVSAASTKVYMTLGEIAESTQESTAFYPALDEYWTAMGKFVDAVRLENL
ncbi:hypothetical protein [Streptomyces sp. NPDC001820]|uniref:hypothetical protein n=1 Tax=Streptomyces sp. NPDC001820 TaxID=3364613 RepID=UPI0036A59865